MDLRTRTMLLCAALAFAITVAILLRSRKRKEHYLLAAFAANMALWYSAQWLLRFFQADVWFRLTAVLAVLLPQLALRLFAALGPNPAKRPTRLLRTATALGMPLLVLAVSNWQSHPASRSIIFLYVFGLVAAGLVDLFLQASRSPSRAVKDRLRLIATVGSLAVILSIADFLWFIGAELPPVGAVLSVVFLFALAESLQRERLIDLYEMIGRLMVSTALAFCLAAIFYAFMTWVGFETMYLNAVLAAIAILLLFEPLRNKVEEMTHTIFFRQRRDLELAVQEAEQRLVHVIEIEELGEAVVAGLGRTRRFTAIAVYLLEPEGNAFALRNATGESAPARIEEATLRPILECLKRIPSITLENVADRRMPVDANIELDAITAAAQVFGRLQTGVVLGIKVPPGEVVGLLIVQDDRVKDAFTVDEVALLEQLLPLISVVVENTRAYERLKERDRLAALGQMAAGLAHEIKNPLGSIKGAAQFLIDSPDPVPDAARDFLEIILEEVDRLDRVVSSALDYARPPKGDSIPLDANAVVRRTMQILGPTATSAVELELDLAESLPRVRIDAEQLRQVLMNLVHNGIHAMGGRGTLTIATRERRGRLIGWDTAGLGVARSWIEIAVTDTGQGISPTILKNLFVPFFTTKARGTGLGLAISQRIVQAAGGVIEVHSREGAGSTFRIVLPAAPEAESRESSRPVAPDAPQDPSIPARPSDT